MNKEAAYKIMIKELKSIKLNGGSPFDYIENDVELIDENYEIAMIALNWNPETNSEKEFDEALIAVFESII